jgi:L-rhamnose isomerase
MDYPKRGGAKVGASYKIAKEIFASFGVDTDKALEKLAGVEVSMHCWQGDDVGGFEVKEDKSLTGGIMATGSFPGKARNPDELRADIDKAFSLIPGPRRLNLHAIYLESNGKFVDRDQISVKHFSKWLDWAKASGTKLDFNPSYFSHPKSASGFTLSSADKAVRNFWVEHGKRSREIAAEFAKAFKSPSVNNVWIPDGFKDLPADRWAPRERLLQSLDEIFKAPLKGVKDAVEGKVFGIGNEECTVGSHEFYLAYAVKNKKLLCLDMGHYHPTETIHDKLPSVMPFVPEVLIHVSRPVRWDSDHVVIFNDELLGLAREIVRGDALGKVYLATDFFDASINRLGAWVVGMRSLKRALLYAMLEPYQTLRKLEAEGRNAERLALSEEAKSLPHGAVWDYFCEKQGVPVSASWLNDLRDYEKKVQSKRK